MVYELYEPPENSSNMYRAFAILHDRQQKLDGHGRITAFSIQESRVPFTVRLLSIRTTTSTPFLCYHVRRISIKYFNCVGVYL